MLKLTQKIVLITGASSGIGKACAEQFAEAGANLILTARRIDVINDLAQHLKDKYHIDVLAKQLDVRNFEQVNHIINELPKNWQKIDILLNNAGVAPSLDKIQDGKICDWDTTIDTNIKGLLYVTHAILPGMISRNTGHIINIGSTTGHEYYPRGNVYCATKHAVKAINKSLRIDLLGLPLRISLVDPGSTATSFRPKAIYEGFTTLLPQDIADAVLYCATRPAHVNVEDIVVYPVDQASTNHTKRTGQERGILE